MEMAKLTKTETEKKAAATKAAAVKKEDSIKKETAAAEAKKPAAKKPAAKKTAAKKPAAAKKTTAAKKPAAAKKTAAAKKPAAKKTAAKETPKKSSFILQFAGKDYDIEQIRKSVDDAVKASKKRGVKTVDIYVKPEDKAVYYVINGKDGSKIDL